ncbi:DUF4229 domain-containing protein [Herbidospora galbida]|uniref:DUF4229 domain-containing protein n=1 Tax=Herbidospora galbida TaxID=2575442 RepID=A0A4U3MJQ2_9ACTN|nr:DUF4229 domain-containing protein [Herbidospora galbida]TKK89778.1 DUF4229 domain-containing protein [Herbidospora galbida]
MHPVIVYTLSRLGLFAVALGVLYLLGLRTYVLLAVAVVLSGLASYVLLSKQRDAVSEKISDKRNQPEG